MIVYEDPSTADGLATWWCHECNRGAGALYAEVLPVYTGARQHNRQHHADGLTLHYSSGTTHGGNRRSDPGRDALIAALAEDGLSSFAIAEEVGLSASGVRSALRRMVKAS